MNKMATISDFKGLEKHTSSIHICVRGRLTLKEVEEPQFRIESFHELNAQMDSNETLMDLNDITSSNSFEDYCNGLEKAGELSGNVVLIPQKYNVSHVCNENRSRHAKHKVISRKHRDILVRDREPSRIPVRKVHSLSRKSRNLQCYLLGKGFLNIPKSSKLQYVLSSMITSINFKDRRKCRRYRGFLQTLKVKLKLFSVYANVNNRRLQMWLKLFSCEYFLRSENEGVIYKNIYSGEACQTFVLDGDHSVQSIRIMN